MSRFVMACGLLLAVSTVHGNALQVDFLSQSPPNVVPAGVSITFTLKNTNVADGSSVESDSIGTGIGIVVNGAPVDANSGEFSSSGCSVDASFPAFWACSNLVMTGSMQTYSFTWISPSGGESEVSFLGLCQEIPIPSGGSRFCNVNGQNWGSTVASVTTIVCDDDNDNDGDGDPNCTDPDDDNDGIGDALDTQPLIPSNLCTGGGGDNATLGILVVDDLTCAARVSIDVQPATQVLDPPAHLRLIAPSTGFQSGFQVFAGGRLTVISADPCPGCAYAIGGTGPAGGIVFYVTDGGLHGLEAAPVDQASARWGCSDTYLGATGVAIGTGAQNTTAIIAGCATSGIAARVAHDYSLNGFDDWFLPSKDELYQLYLRMDDVGVSPSAIYWSSSEFNIDGAWVQYFGNGGQFIYFKFGTEGVRAVRAF